MHETRWVPRARVGDRRYGLQQLEESRISIVGFERLNQFLTPHALRECGLPIYICFHLAPLLKYFSSCLYSFFRLLTEKFAKKTQRYAEETLCELCASVVFFAVRGNSKKTKLYRVQFRSLDPVLKAFLIPLLKIPDPLAMISVFFVIRETVEIVTRKIRTQAAMC
jgi:hypothetical protein